MEFLPYEKSPTAAMGVSEERVKELELLVEADLAKGESRSREAIAIAVAVHTQTLNEFYVLVQVFEFKGAQQASIVSTFAGAMGLSPEALKALLSEK